ncbi:MAG: glutamate formimidoyltransferase [Candidatus Eremiobacteraeota bacterium]|nr:glutamate formimidoyltransferase [Candidatus Eremiobacteraeota bacterium]
MPNVSEGRDKAILDACAAAIEDAGATLAHRTSDDVHHRSVFTFFGDAKAVGDAALALARVTTEKIDLREHRGAHPRIGALDVLPFVPLGDATMDDAVKLARGTAKRIWDELHVPSVFYANAAASPQRRLLADVRTGEFEGLIERGHRGGPPDVGDVQAHPSAGAIAVGARDFLIAFNVVLRTGDLGIARDIARCLRERNGGLRTLRALGIKLGDFHTQISCNITDVHATPLHRVVGLIRTHAARYGVGIEGCELIGLIPRAALNSLAAHELGG